MLLQNAVFVYAVLVQYVLKLSKDGQPVIGYGVQLFVIGMVVLSQGMFVCSAAVETRTIERHWVPTEPENTEVIWILQGGQTVGDQRFESFARCKAGSGVITSNKSMRREGSTLAPLGAAFSLVGFVIQFVAVRATHATVIGAQLGAVLIMTAVRSRAHIQRGRRGGIENPGEVEGHELDLLASRIHGCKEWEVAVMSVDPPNDPAFAHIADQSPLPRNRFVAWIASLTAEKSRSQPPIIESERERAAAAMQTQAQVGELSSYWVLPLRDSVQLLQNIHERTMNEIYASMTVTDDWKMEARLCWSLTVLVELDDGSRTQFPLELNMSRKRDENSHWLPGTVPKNMLEAVMSLWITSMRNETTGAQDTRENGVYLTPGSEGLPDLDLSSDGI